MTSVGETFLSRTPGYDTEHLFIIIGIIGTAALFVNITSKKETSDCACVLDKGDHPFIKHESVINYADAKECHTSLIDQALSSKVFKAHSPVSPELLDRILYGAKVSQAFPAKYLKYIK